MNSLLSCHIVFRIMGSQVAGARSPGRLNFLRRRLILCTSSVLNLLHVTFLAPGILRWLLELWKFCDPLYKHSIFSSLIALKNFFFCLKISFVWDMTLFRLLCRWWRFGKTCCLHPEDSPGYCSWSTLKLEAAGFSETLIPVYQSPQPYVPLCTPKMKAASLPETLVAMYQYTRYHVR